jgi:hypothetical protein
MARFLTESIDLKAQITNQQAIVDYMKAQIEGGQTEVVRLQGLIEALQRDRTADSSRIAALEATVAQLQVTQRELLQKQEDAEGFVLKVATATSELTWLCEKGIPNLIVDPWSPLLTGRIVTFADVLDLVQAVEFLPVPADLWVVPNPSSGRVGVAQYPVLDQHLQTVPLESLAILPHRDGLTGRLNIWNPQMYYGCLNVLDEATIILQKAARNAQSIWDPTIIMEVDTRHFPFIRVGIRNGIIWKMIYPFDPTAVTPLQLTLPG